MHLDEELTLRFVHGELDEPTDHAVRHHLAGCGACRARVEHDMGEEAEVISLLERLDHPRPALAAKEVMDEPARPHGRPRRRRSALILLLLFVAVAGTAWAVPGSPARPFMESWIDRAAAFLSSQLGEPGPGTESDDLPAVTPPGADPDSTAPADDPGLPFEGSVG